MKTPVIETARLVLRPFLDSDLDDFLAYFLNPEVRFFLGGFPPGDAANAAVLFRGNLIAERDWAVELKGERRVVGEVLLTDVVCGYLGKIGYLFNQNFWGKGYAAEAVKAVVDYGLNTLGLGRIRAETMLANTRSLRLLERCGFEREALIYEADFGGRVADVFYYSVTL